MALPLAAIGTTVIANALKGLFAYFSPSKLYERRRLEDRKQEVEKIGRDFETRLNNAMTKISSSPAIYLGFAIDEYKAFRHSEDSYAKWTPQGRYTWENHNSFDYPSAKVGAHARWAIVSEACKRMETFLAETYPTYAWNFKFVKVSPEAIHSENQKAIAGDMMGKLAIPLILVGLSLFSS